jgi:UDP-glucose 4-epimerase
MDAMNSCSRVLVTGGAGFIGSHLVDRLLAEDIEVVVLDNLQGGRLENIHHHVGKKNFCFARGDIRDSHLVRNLVKDVDAIVHQAAQVSIPESIENPVLTNDVNVNGTLNLLMASVESDVKRFVYASSCAVYGDAEVMPIKEDCLPRPTSPYGASKLAAENYVRVFYEVFRLKTVCLRYFNVFGSRQVYNNYSGVITQFVNRLAKNLPLVIFGDGEQSRDFVHVQDVVEANMLALKNRSAVGVFNVATGIATTINQLANTLLGITNKSRLKVVHSKPRKGDIKHSVGDLSKAQERLHYNVKFSLKEGLRELVESYGILARGLSG